MTTRFPMTKDLYLQQLAAGRVPLRFGFVFHKATVVHEDGVYRVRELVMDPGVAAANADAVKWGDGYNRLVGFGRTVLEAPTLDALVAQLRALEPWPRDWD